MTHDDLVARAARWLKNTKNCGVVLTEWHSYAAEIPDAIGWQANPWNTHLIECKTSLGDFYADKKKPGRYGRRAYMGCGRLRYYMAEPGILSVDLVRRHRPKWGLLEVRKRTVTVALQAERFCLETAWRELPLLYAYARRMHQYGLTPDQVQDAVGKAAEAKTQPRVV